MSVDVGILNTILDSFQAVFIGGMQKTLNIALGEIGSLIVIDFVLAHLLKLGETEPIMLTVTKFLKYGAFIGAVESWPKICNMAVKGFIIIGLAAGGDGAPEAIMTSPSTFLGAGFNLIEPLTTYMTSFTGMDVLFNLVNITLVGIAALGILAAFIILSVEVFVTYLEFFLASTVAVVFVPGGVLTWTSFLAERAFAAVIGFGTKFMVLSAIVSAAYPLLKNWSFPLSSTPKWQEAMVVMVGCWLIAYLALKAPSMAAGLFSGSPTLSGSGIAAAGMAASYMAGRAGGALADGLGSLGRGAAGLGGAIKGGAAGKQGGLAMAVGALGGAAGHMADGMANFGGMKDAYNAGQDGGSQKTSGFSSGGGIREASSDKPVSSFSSQSINGSAYDSAGNNSAGGQSGVNANSVTSGNNSGSTGRQTSSGQSGNGQSSGNRSGGFTPPAGVGGSRSGSGNAETGFAGRTGGNINLGGATSGNTFRSSSTGGRGTGTIAGVPAIESTVPQPDHSGYTQSGSSQTGFMDSSGRSQQDFGGSDLSALSRFSNSGQDPIGQGLEMRPQYLKSDKED